MRSYGLIPPGYWRDHRIAALGGGARLLGVYLVTGPHCNSIGCYFLPPTYVAADLGWAPEQAAEELDRLASIGFVMVCQVTQFVLIPHFLQWDGITNPNVAKKRMHEFNQVPKEFSHYKELCESMKAFGKHWPKDFATFLEVFETPLASVDESLPASVPEGYAKSSTYTSTNTVTRTSKARRAEKPNSAPPGEPKAESTRGTRFKRHPDGIPDDWRAAAQDMRPDLDPVKVYDSFADHWMAKAGSYGVKLDWLATWRNWLRKEPAGRPGTAAARSGNGSPTVPDQWWKTDEGVHAKALELEVTPPKAGAPGEWLMFKARVIFAAGEGPWRPDERDLTLYRAVEWLKKQPQQ